MGEDRAANQRSVFSLSFTLALYISNRFELSESNGSNGRNSPFGIFHCEIFDRRYSSIFRKNEKFKHTWVSGHFRWLILKVSWMNTHDITWIFRSYFSAISKLWILWKIWNIFENVSFWMWFSWDSKAFAMFC